MFSPGVPFGTMIIDMPSYGETSGSVTSITIRKSALDPFDVNHLWPLMTHSSPSRTVRVQINVGSAPAPGSVIENALRISPARSGFSHRSFCSSVPYSPRISLLPESGAWLPNTLGAMSVDRPMISFSSASFTWP